jgi:two-component system cell cycle sensor histidine kinase/response regulator CckA
MSTTLSPATPTALANAPAIAAILARQAELEQQNQSLREARDIVASALARHETLYEQAPVGYATVDDAATVMSANRALSELLRTPRAQLLGRSWLSVVDHDDRTRMIGLLDDVMDDGSPGPIEVHLRSEAVGVLTVAIAATRDVPANRCRLVITDQTRQRDAERIKQQVLRMEAVGRLSAGLAHTFNNLLTIIGCHNEFLLGGLHPSSELLEHTDAIREAVARAAQVTNRLLAYASPRPTTVEELDVNEAVTEFAELFRSLRYGKAELRVTLGARAGRVRADPVLVQQVLMNLALNAVEAMPNGGHVTVRTDAVASPHPGAAALPGGPFVRVRIIDDGAGMNEEVLARAFEPYFSTKDEGTGYGVGLPTVQAIVEQAGGVVRALSAPGRGAQLEVVLPACEAATAH